MWPLQREKITMPKKSEAGRSGAQRSKPKQKSFELVRPSIASREQEPEEELVIQEAQEVPSAELASASVSKTTTVQATPKPVAKTVIPEVVEEPVTPEPVASTASKGSASASSRLAARRQANSKTHQRVAAPLVTVEHYAYVRKDLMFIAVLAAIMFAAIIILHFVPGIGS
jgi:hypothetical protein